ncbi:MAG: spore germination protein GerPC [Bacillota bacterium]|nr:spore germination protein GerPC [Bacillota bacterium]
MSNNDELEKRVQNLEKRIEFLTTLVNKIGDSRRPDVHYHIHTLEIGNAQIDKLDYHLESIAIEQLSGTLNIGNNFDAKDVTSPQEPTFKKKEQKKEVPIYRPLRKKHKQKEEDQRISVISSKSGFSVKINGMEET